MEIVQLPHLSAEAIEYIYNLSEQVPYTTAEGFRCRAGINAPGIMSVYSYSKKWSWSADQRQTLQELLPDGWDTKIQEMYFIKFPCGGFLDIIDLTRNETNAVQPAFKAVSIPLSQTKVMVDHKTYDLSPCTVNYWSLADRHSVPIDNHERVFLVLLTMRDYKEL